MKDNIVVVGGYGHVGKMICKELGDLHPGKVYAAAAISNAQSSSASQPPVKSSLCS